VSVTSWFISSWLKKQVSEKAREGMLLTEVGGTPSALSMCWFKVERMRNFLSGSI
jgi:hypothetical protein